MDPGTLAACAGAFFFAAFVKGTTGIGFSTSALPLLVLAVGLKEALPLVLIPSITSNLLVMRDAGNFRQATCRFWPIYLGALAGLVVGLWLLDALDPKVSAAVLGAILIAYALFALASPSLALPAAWERPLRAPVGLLTGTVNGLTGSQVMPLLPYLMALRLEPALFLQSINISFTLSSLVMIAGLSKIGLMTWNILGLSVAALIPLAVGFKLGSLTRRRLSPEGFRRAVLIVLIFLGGTLLARPFLF